MQKVINRLLKDCDRVAGSILLWEHRRAKDILRIKKKIESRGPSSFSRKDKIVISEMITEFGQQAPKITISLSMIEELVGKVRLPLRKYPNLCEYLDIHRFYPPLTIKHEK